jgi:hypothetical protein
MLNSVSLPAEKAGRVIDALETAFLKLQALDVLVEREESIDTQLVRTALHDMRDAMFPEDAA